MDGCSLMSLTRSSQLLSVRARTEPTSPVESRSLERTRCWGVEAALTARMLREAASVSYMSILIPESGPGGMPSKSRACQHPPMPVKRSRTRIEGEPAVWARQPGPEDRGGSVGLEETPDLWPGAVPPEAPTLVAERGVACA